MPAHAVVVGFFLLALIGGAAQAQTFTLLYTFTGGADGGDPEGGLIIDSLGNLYGTTAVGGNPACLHGCGTVFKLDTSGKESVLYSFTGTSGDGYFPSATLVQDVQGNLYGTAQAGGAYGFGTAFKIDSSGNETILHSFTGGADGGSPLFGGLVMDDQGNLYGTTISGGDLACGGGSGCGTVFMLNNAGAETVIYSFTGTGGDGTGPSGALLRDAQGNLHGTTRSTGIYGRNGGTVFKVDPTGKETVLFSFNGSDGLDGLNPVGAIVEDTQGNLYGATESGGHGVVGGNGVVFELTKKGKEKVLHRFAASGKSGYYPEGGVVQDSQGNLYGTTLRGGVPLPGSFSCGTVFQIAKGGKEILLHSLTGGSDGAFPYAGLVQDAQGNLYGVTTGTDETTGTVFKIAP